MELTLPTTPAEKFASLLQALREGLAAQSAKNRLLAPLFGLVWSRLGRIARHFAHLAARLPAGAPPRPHTTRPRATQPLPRPPQPGPARPPAPHRWAHLPRRPGWCIHLAAAAIPAASRLRHLLADPDMAALLAASPGLRRTLRPLCRMLGVPPPAAPPAQAPSAPAPTPAPALSAMPPAAMPPAAMPPPAPPPAPRPAMRVPMRVPMRAPTSAQAPPRGA